MLQGGTSSTLSLFQFTVKNILTTTCYTHPSLHSSNQVTSPTETEGEAKASTEKNLPMRILNSSTRDLSTFPWLMLDPTLWVFFAWSRCVWSWCFFLRVVFKCVLTFVHLSSRLVAERISVLHYHRQDSLARWYVIYFSSWFVRCLKPSPLNNDHHQSNHKIQDVTLSLARFSREKTLSKRLKDLDLIRVLLRRLLLLLTLESFKNWLEISCWEDICFVCVWGGIWWCEVVEEEQPRLWSDTNCENTLIWQIANQHEVK